MSESDLSLSFELIGSSLSCVDSSRDFKEQLLQYNLDETLQTFKFRFNGQFSGHSSTDYDNLLKEFFSDKRVLQSINAMGEVTTSVTIRKEPIGLHVMTMDFFDRLQQGG